MNKKVSNVVDLAKARNNKNKVIRKKALQTSKPRIGVVNSLCSKIKSSFNNLTKTSVKKTSALTKPPLSRKQKLSIINHIVSYYQDGASFAKPEFIEGVYSQEQLDNLEVPLVYIWQESVNSKGKLEFNCGINKQMIKVLLKSMLAPTAKEFQEIQNKVISSLKTKATKMILKKHQELALLPSQFLNVFSKS